MLDRILVPSVSPVTVREKLAYGLGDAAFNLFWKTFTMFLMFFYTDVFGLAPAAAGLMFLITRGWAALFDPVMGFIADRTSTRWGKFRPYLLWMAVPFGVFGILTFSTPAWGAEGKLVYAYVTYTLMMLAYSAMNVPYSALLGVISPNSRVRTSVSAYRFAFAFGGSVVVQFSMQRLVAAFGGGHEAQGYHRAAIVLGVVSTFLFLLCFAGTRERVVPLRQQRTSLRTDARDLSRNGPWLVLLALMVTTQIASSVRDGTILYYFKYYVFDTEAAANFMAVGSLAAIAGIVVLQRVLQVVGKRRAFIGLMLATAGTMVATFWIRPDQWVALYLTHIAINFLIGPVFVIIWALKADTVDYSEWKTGRRATGLVFSASGVASKVGWAIGGSMIGWTLEAFGFQANALQSASAQAGIRLMISVFPAAAALAAAAIMVLYRLDDETMSRIESDLQTRRAEPAR